MEEDVPSATGSEPVKEKCLIWCGKQINQINQRQSEDKY